MSDWRDVRVLYLHELRSALRERNIVVYGILLPIIFYPLLLYIVYTGVSLAIGREAKDRSRISIGELPAGHETLKDEMARDRRIEIIAARNAAGDVEEEIRQGRLDLHVEFLPVERGVSLARDVVASRDFKAKLTYDKSRDRSSTARDRFTVTLDRYREFYLEEEASRRGIPPARFQMLWTEMRNVATNVQMVRYFLGLLLPTFLILMVSVGTMYPAIDSTAGEREKATWETLMTTATPRRNIIVAKYLYVSTMAVSSGVLNITAMLVSFRQLIVSLAAGAESGFDVSIPLGAVPVVLLCTVLLALFVAAGMMILASFTRTFKEGQAMVTPFYMLTMVPVLFLQSPDLAFTPAMALTPIVNVALVFREAISGVYHWRLIGLTLLSEVVCVALCMKLAAAILRQGDFMLGGYSGNFFKFVRHRLLGGGRKPSGREDGI
ncbi:MAG: ABC transporter permease subunit [Acidobacteriota bacterium]|jgi:sodium transport system permease protein|nr:ABC transporter permease subunit [Acidobacteriota bacterium]